MSIIKKLADNFSLGSQTDEDFVRLIQLAQEDKAINTTLRSLLELPQKDRLPAVEVLLARIEADGAPQELIDVLGLLRDEKIADKAREILS